MTYQHGESGEMFFVDDLLKQKVIDYENVDTWYDYRVFHQKVEVKSCRLTVKGTGKLRAGRFEFRYPGNRVKQFDQDVWVCFIIRHGSQHINLGFVRAKKLKQRRCISVLEVQRLKPISVREWVKQYDTNTITRS